MPRPLAIAPDDELATLQYLRSIPQLTALVPAANIIEQLPAKPTYPYLLVQRVAGQSTSSPGLDEPVLQLDSLGGKRFDCKRIILTARAALLAIANDTVPAGVLVSAYEEIGPSWLPDTISVPPIPRYTARIRLLLHA